MLNPISDRHSCQQARLSRDPRFDGLFFTAVKTTGIFCRSVCPATPPKEQNVDYYSSAVAAAEAGYRPCLRCRPDAAPHSSAWLGTAGVIKRATRLIDEGFLEHQSLVNLADHLGITDRYLRQLFKQHLGISPKRYVTYQQCLFAKQLLHQTKIPMVDVALASGFGSVRRFNASIKEVLKLTPSQIRKTDSEQNKGITLTLSYRPPYDWSHWRDFMKKRLINGMEWVSDNSYGRVFNWADSQGRFEAIHKPELNAFEVTITLDQLTHLRAVVNNIRRVLDLDVDSQQVRDCLKPLENQDFSINPGLRLPGIWSVFEAGIRAILGQQVSVKAAQDLVTKLVHECGKKHDQNTLFPNAEQLIDHPLDALKMPAARKQSIRDLAQFASSQQEQQNPDHWLTIKGVGPWTVAYAKMRGLSDPDVFLAGDLGVIKALDKFQTTPTSAMDAYKPWRSYLTFHLWNQP